MGFAREAQPHGLAAGDTRSGPQGPSPALWAGVKDTGRDEGQGSGCGGGNTKPSNHKSWYMQGEKPSQSGLVEWRGPWCKRAKGFRPIRLTQAEAWFMHAQ
ncbi:hypothetical protein ACFX15_014443 [Malus domestica]